MSCIAVRKSSALRGGFFNGDHESVVRTKVMDVQTYVERVWVWPEPITERKYIFMVPLRITVMHHDGQREEEIE